MTSSDLLGIRLKNQQLLKTKFTQPQDLVAWLGAVQSQDYPAAKWALGQRLSNSTDSEIDAAFNKAEILRTHIMRPTWHFVSPKDIRWLQKLTAPRVEAVSAYYFRQQNLTDKVFQKSQEVITQSLKGNQFLTRDELGQKFEASNLPSKGLALAYIIIKAELDALICSGPRHGKQFTYALISERAPQATNLNLDESLAQLTQRYFQSHGPATIKDFSWWSGLTVSEVKRGLNLFKNLITQEIDNQTYYLFESQLEPIPPTAFLLPNYDEYGIAYKGRNAFYNPRLFTNTNPRESSAFSNLILINGQVLGLWRKTLKKDTVNIDTQFMQKPSAAQLQMVEAAAQEYANFLNLKLILK